MKHCDTGSGLPSKEQSAEPVAHNPSLIPDMVKRALAEGRVIAAFQPVVDARGVSRVAFHEALIRIRTDGGVLLPPGQFLPAVQDAALVSALDRKVLSLVLDRLAERPDARIAVNVAGPTTRDPDWLELLTRKVREMPDVGFRLIVELNEQDAVWTEASCGRFLHSLRDLGVSIALDDFGAGATGFQCFRDQRFDIVKIDGSYGDGLSRDLDSQVLVRAMVDIARHFEMLTVIEFIATPADAGKAIEIGMDCLQGNMFGRPATELERPTGEEAMRRLG